MNVIIIEDELLAQAKLETMLYTLDKSIVVLTKLSSVKDSIQWLSQNPSPDLAFVDIQLSDDHSFEIFRKHPVSFPVIFTTAYDKYLLESFEFNAIDYLLKPITEEKLKRSLEKVAILRDHFLQGNLLKFIQNIPQQPVRNRIIAKKGTEFVAMDLCDIAYFYTEHKIVFAKDFSGRQLILDKTIGELESEISCKDFFRINRKFLANLKSIERFKPDNGKIRVYLNPEMKEEVHVSKETAPEFRLWIEG
ncbi:MAG TPA: LytTR family DNA-binding domain-containing protein, partial [Ohtaekwangia sp.]|uniref:LytR/AlgR family response regulator transcription factor n=1 Tax=Ohtaekwangia sp. TaxID=2066019 RepID=UPI002F929A06